MKIFPFITLIFITFQLKGMEQLDDYDPQIAYDKLIDKESKIPKKERISYLEDLVKLVINTAYNRIASQFSYPRLFEQPEPRQVVSDALKYVIVNFSSQIQQNMNNTGEQKPFNPILLEQELATLNERYKPIIAALAQLNKHKGAQYPESLSLNYFLRMVSCCKK